MPVLPRLFKPNGGIPVQSQNSVSLPKQEFLPDSRIEPIWERLTKELSLPEDAAFATSFDPSRWVEGDSGITYLKPESIVFWVIAPNPQPRWKGKYLKQFASMELEEWRKAEAARLKWVGGPDVALEIFRTLGKRLIVDFKSWQEMN